MQRGRCVAEVLPKFKLGDNYPAFWKHMISCLSLFKNDSSLSLDKWRKAYEIIITNLFLKPPLVRSAFFDNIHEVLQSLGKDSLDILVSILTERSLESTDWKTLTEHASHPAIAFVIRFNNNKKTKDGKRDKKRAGKQKGEENMAEEDKQRKGEGQKRHQQWQPLEDEQQSESSKSAPSEKTTKEKISSESEKEEDKASTVQTSSKSEKQEKEEEKQERFERKMKKKLDKNEKFKKKLTVIKHLGQDGNAAVIEYTSKSLLKLYRHVKQHGRKGCRVSVFLCL